jgi:glycosyltransferase involved in cell wall biosynthesis
LANIDSLSEGGAEAQFKTLGFALANMGFKVHFIVDDYGQPDIVKLDDVIIHKVALRYLGGPNYYILPAWAKLWSTLFKIEADIHLIKVPRDLLLPVGLFCKIRGKKLVFIGQMDTDVDPDFLKRENLFAYLLFRAGLLFVNNTVGQNEKQRLGFLHSYNKKACTIRNIVTLPETNNIKVEEYILWVGNNHPKKQPEKFLLLAERLPGYQFKMIMSVTPQNSNDRHIRDRLVSVPNLEYLGFVPFSHIAPYFQGASLFVSTSKREGFPNTFLQSWQYRTPVVSLHVDPDGVIEKYNLGRHSRSFEKLQSDVKQLMDNEKLREEMGENAKKYVQKNHSADVIIPQYVKLLRDCL